LVRVRSVGTQYLLITITWLVSCIVCALAIAYFYDLLGSSTIYPFKNASEQGVAILKTAVSATLVSSWAIWLGTKGDSSFGKILLKAGIPMQLTFALYAVIGLNVDMADRRMSIEWIFPSTFFAEYNWLTFILEVAPVTALAASLLLYSSRRWMFPAG